MNCYLSGMAGLGLLAASAFTLSVSDEQHEKLKTVLSPKLDEIYDKISNERRNQYIQGLILGLIVAFFVLYSGKISNRFYRTSLFFTITLTIAVLYYFLMPKSDYMLNHLKTPEENKAWLEVYKTMKFRYFLGFLLGALAAIPLANIMC
jgi:uncharacterized protein YacL